MRRRRPFGWFVLTSVLGAGCFPDNVLQPFTDGAVADVADDLGKPKDAGFDAGRIDVPVVDASDAGFPADMGLPDASDGGGDTGTGIEGPACEMTPTGEVPSRVVLEDLAGARDFTFDGRGGVAISLGTTVVLRRDRDTLPVTMVMSGEVTALRYTRNFGLVLATEVRTDAGTSSGAIYQLLPGETVATLRQGSLRSAGGLAIGPDDSIWFSDTEANTIYRMPGDGMSDAGTAARAVVTDVMRPTQLLYDAMGRYLFVAQPGLNKVVRLDLNVGDAGAVGAPTDFVVGLDSVAGLAQDECGNVFVADSGLNRIYRAPLDSSRAVSRAVSGIVRPRAVMFGTGAPFGPREIYSLSAMDGTLRAANLIARGVPLPVPAR